MLNSTFISLLKESLKEDDVSDKKIYKIFFRYYYIKDKIYFDFERVLTPEEVKKFAVANIKIGPTSDQTSPIKDEDLYIVEYNKKESEKQDLHIHLLLLSKSEFDKLKSDIARMDKFAEEIRKQMYEGIDEEGKDRVLGRLGDLG